MPALLRRAVRDLLSPPPTNVGSLDVLRCAAIALVICDHVGESVGGRVATLPFVNFGWTGVDLFFVLSGYLIGMQLWKELKRSGSVNVGRFVIRRGFRIWPLYFAFVAFVLAAFVAFRRPLLPILADLACVSNYARHYVGGGWSLSTEEQFYLLAPTLLWLLARRWAPQRLWLLPACWLVLLPLLRLAAGTGRIYYPFHTHSDGLAIGLLLAWLTVFRPRVLNVPGVIVLPAAAFVGLVMRSEISQLAFGYTSLALIYGGALWLALQHRKFGSRRGFYIGSRLSYGMYLNHFYLYPVLTLVAVRVFGAGAGGFIFGLAATMAISLVASFVGFALIEFPFLERRTSWLAAHTPVLQAQSATAASRSI